MPERSHDVRTDTGPFAIVPVALLSDPAVDDRALRLYVALSSYADRGGEAWPTQESLAERLGCSVPTVKRGLATLVDAGWCDVGKRRDQAGRVLGNSYVLRRSSPQGIRSDPLIKGSPVDPPDRSPVDPPGGSPVDPSIDEQTSRTDQGNRPNELAPLALVPPTAATVGNDQRVFDLWITTTDRTDRTDFSPARRRMIRAALKAYPLDDVLDAVRGMSANPWNRGANPGQQRYDDLKYAIDRPERIERHRDEWRNTRPVDASALPVPETWKTLRAMGIMQ